MQIHTFADANVHLISCAWMEVLSMFYMPQERFLRPPKCGPWTKPRLAFPRNALTVLQKGTRISRTKSGSLFEPDQDLRRGGAILSHGL